MNPERIAYKIVGMIADGRLTYPLIEAVGYWIAQYSAGTGDGESKILTFAESIITNIREIHDQHSRD